MSVLLSEQVTLVPVDDAGAVYAGNVVGLCSCPAHGRCASTVLLNSKHAPTAAAAAGAWVGISGSAKL
jgi:hypothetical protein